MPSARPLIACAPRRTFWRPLAALNGCAVGLALLLAACAPPTDPQPPARAPADLALMPIAARVSGARPASVRTNTALARDFMELAFDLETGRTLPRLTRFEGPVSVRMTGSVPATAPQDLAQLLARLRTEAGIAISDRPGAANTITLEFLPRRKMQALVPNAACFVAPNVTGWQDYRRARRTARVDWAALMVRDQVAVFIPSDSSPQEVRDCLHEEIAQALGPLNDLYRLPDSVFNDDNFHTVLTDFDMGLLRIHYAPELRSGMTAAEVAARLPAILARENPQGGPVGSVTRAPPTPREFVRAIEEALSPGRNSARRKTAAARAVAIANAEGWSDTRAGFAWYALGRLSLPGDPEAALAAFVRAGQIYRALPGGGIQAAHVDMQMAAFALSAGHGHDALTLADRSLGPAAESQNAALLATLYLIRAQAYDAIGLPREAAQARLDSAGWARYGFGSDVAVRKRAAEVAALTRTAARAN